MFLELCFQMSTLRQPAVRNCCEVFSVSYPFFYVVNVHVNVNNLTQSEATKVKTKLTGGSFSRAAGLVCTMSVREKAFLLFFLTVSVWRC